MASLYSITFTIDDLSDHSIHIDISEKDCALVLENPSIEYVHIPTSFKSAINNLKRKYPEIDAIVDLSLILAEHRYVAPYETMKSCTQQLIDLLTLLNITDLDPEVSALAAAQQYLHNLEIGTPRISSTTVSQLRNLSTTQISKNPKTRSTAWDANLPEPIAQLGYGLIYSMPFGDSLAAGVTGDLGVDGQVLICASNAPPSLAHVGAADGSVLFTHGPGSLTLQSTPLLGNIIRVDQQHGNDYTGTVNSLPFETINGALAAASPGNVVWVFPGTYQESFTIPNGVSVIGMSLGGSSSAGVLITENVSVPTDLVTMGENSRLQNVSLSLTSSSHVQLRGIVFPGTTSATAKVSNVDVMIDNSAAPTNGSSNVYGIHSIGTGSPNATTYTLNSTHITIHSIGLGAKRGVLIDAANNLNINNSCIMVTNTGSGSAISTETKHPSASCIASSSTLSGSTADISQTLGTLIPLNTQLLNATANGLGFSTTVPPATINWDNQENFQRHQQRDTC